MSPSLLPGECRDLLLQSPTVPSRENIIWKSYQRGRGTHSVACIAVELLPAFKQFECERVNIKQLCMDKKKLSEGTKRRAAESLHELYRCPYGAERKKAVRDKVAEGVTVAHTAAAASQQAETVKRVGKVSRGRSIKSCECAYTMKFVVYANSVDRAYVWLFNGGDHSKSGETTPCHGPESEGHASFLGAPSISAHLKQLVQQCLRDGLTPAKIIASTSGSVCENGVYKLMNVAPMHEPTSQLRILVSKNKNIERLHIKHGVNGSPSSAQIAAIKASPDSRDYCLDTRDVANLRVRVDFEQFMHHAKDAQSLQSMILEDMHKPENKRFFLHATISDKDNAALLLVAAHPDMLQWAARYGHERVVSMDATFGTTCYGYSLLTATVADHDGRGKPIMFAIMNSDNAVDIASALGHLEEHVKKIRPDWRPSAFIIDDSDAERNGIEKAFPGMKAFLCIYHQRATFLKVICNKLRNASKIRPIIKAVEADLVAILRFDGGDTEEESLQLATKLCKDFCLKWAAEAQLIEHFKTFWLPKLRWWCLGYRKHTCTSDQDTSSISEGWHSYLKSSDEVSNKLKGRRLDWLIWVLRDKIVPYYQAELGRRELGHGYNKRAERTALAAIEAASVMCSAAGPLYTWISLEHSDNRVRVATVKSPESHSLYKLERPLDDVAPCSCPEGIQGKTCKHHVVVLQYVYSSSDSTPAAKRAFDNLLVDGLGTNFARSGGCQPEEGGLAALTQSLQISTAMGSLPDADACASPAQLEECIPSAHHEENHTHMLPALDPELLQSPRTPERALSPDIAPSLGPTPSKLFVTCNSNDAAELLGLPQVQQMAATLASPKRRQVMQMLTAQIRQTLSFATSAAADDERCKELTNMTPALAPASYAQRQTRALDAIQRSHQSKRRRSTATHDTCQPDGTPVAPGSNLAQACDPAPMVLRTTTTQAALKARKKPRRFTDRLDKAIARYPQQASISPSHQALSHSAVSAATPTKVVASESQQTAAQPQPCQPNIPLSAVSAYCAHTHTHTQQTPCGLMSDQGLQQADSTSHHNSTQLQLLQFSARGPVLQAPDQLTAVGIVSSTALQPPSLSGRPTDAVVRRNHMHVQHEVDKCLAAALRDLDRC